MCLCKLQRSCVNLEVLSQIGWQPIPQAVITAEVMLPHTVRVMVAFQLLILKNTLVIALLDLPLNLIDLNQVLQILQTAAVLLKRMIQTGCKEINKVVAKMGETEDELASCITRHSGFEGVCLNVWVLQAAYYQYRQEHGMDALPASMHEYAYNT